MMEVYKNLNFNEFNIYLPFLNKLEAELENDRDLSQNIIHVDMDAFYAAVEELDNPKLRGVPTAVGGPNMLCTANYEARKYGVRSAMPGFIAKELCPKLNIVPCRFDRYTEISRQVCEIFERYDLNYRAVSLDEAYLNITNYCNENQISAYDAVTKLREEIFEKTKLTASAGIACNSLLAKIASDHRKPNGQFMLESSREEVIKFISSLPIRKVTGIGRVTERVLNSLGIEKCQDIYENRAIVYCLFYEKTFMFLFKASLGIANTNIEILESRKSVGISRTFGELSNLEDLLNKLKELAKSLSEDIEKKKIKGKTVTLTIKSVDFDVRVKSKSFPRYLATCDDLFEAGKKLLIKEHPVSLRLLGLRLSNLISTDENENKNSILKVSPFVLISFSLHFVVLETT
ncbi:UMUC-like DNA-repair protein [Neoconidiobolus thromboides FSU 785]|nr:UMUC-like DNA-repair protein [Neoconidiobolus thromboides FSU 785]